MDFFYGEAGTENSEEITGYRDNVYNDDPSKSPQLKGKLSESGELISNLDTLYNDNPEDSTYIYGKLLKEVAGVEIIKYDGRATQTATTIVDNADNTIKVNVNTDIIATKDYVESNGGKIDNILLNNIIQPIETITVDGVQYKKAVNLTDIAKASDLDTLSISVDESIDNINNSISDINDDITNLKSDVETNEHDILDLQDTTSQLNSDLSELSDSIDQSLQQIDSDISDINDSISSINDNIDQIENNVSSNADAISDLQDAVASNDQDISDLQSAVESNTSDISDLDTNKLDKNTDVTTYKQAYVKNEDGTQTFINIKASDNASGSIPIRSTNGDLLVPDTPSNDNSATSKLYVDTQVDSKGSSLSLEVDNQTFELTATLYDANGNVLGEAQTVDLPIESLVVSGEYDDSTESIILTLQSGQSIIIPLGDLIDNLQTEITVNNKLSADLVDDTDTINKFVTAQDKTTWDAKQDALIAGDNITIDNNVISANGANLGSVILEQDLYTYANVGNITTASPLNAVKVADEGDSLNDVWQTLFGQKDEQPVITSMPSLSLSFYNYGGNSQEYGTHLTSLPFNLTKTQGSYTYDSVTGVTWAGNPTFTLDGSELSYDNTVLYIDYTVGSSSAFNIQVSQVYNSGNIASTLLGNESDPPIRIASGTASASKTFSVSSLKYAYYGVNNSSTVPIDNNSRCTLTKRSTSGTAGTYTFNPQSQYLWLATPTQINSITWNGNLLSEGSNEDYTYKGTYPIILDTGASATYYFYVMNGTKTGSYTYVIN